MAGVDTTRSVLRASLESTYASPPTGGPSSSSSSSRAGGSEDGGSRPGGSATPSTLPSWAESMFTSGEPSSLRMPTSTGSSHYSSTPADPCRTPWAVALHAMPMPMPMPLHDIALLLQHASGFIALFHICFPGLWPP